MSGVRSGPGVPQEWFQEWAGYRPGVVSGTAQVSPGRFEEWYEGDMSISKRIKKKRLQSRNGGSGESKTETYPLTWTRPTR